MSLHGSLVRKGRLLRGPREPSVAEIPHSEWSPKENDKLLVAVFAWFWKQSPAWFYLPLCRWGEEARIWRLWYKELRYVQWRIQGERPGGSDAPLLFLGQTEVTDVWFRVFFSKKKSGFPIECFSVFATGCSKFLLQDMSVCNPGHPVDYRCESEQYQ